MKKSLLVYFLLLLSFQLHAVDFYWVGGAGSWSQLSHWRLGSSAGNTASTVPSSVDNVFFDTNSGFTGTQTITIDANAFCNNMTWSPGIVSKPAITRAAGNTITLSGNLSLSPGVNYTNLIINLIGGTVNTLTTNGVVTGSISLNINKPGGGITLTDDLIYTNTSSANSTLTLVAGSLNAAGKTLTIYGFSSASSVVRSVDISNGKINMSRLWTYQGANKTLNAAGSYLKLGVELHVDSGTYPQVEVGGSSSGYFDISNCTFDKLLFTATSRGATARIFAGNTIDTLLFMGSGGIRSSNNKVNYVVFGGDGMVGGTGNRIGYMGMNGKFDIIDSGGNTFDSLLTTPNYNIKIAGTNTINKYFRAGGLPCDGFTEITGGTLAFTAGANVDIDNVLLTSLTATGPITPITVNGIDNDDNVGFDIIQPAGAGTTLYWVGGAGDWNDKTHWSTTSGGPGGACIPFITDNVVFNGGSGFTGSSVVTTSANSYCNDMTWAPGITGTPVFNRSSSFTLQVYGSIVLNPAVTMNAVLDLRGAVNQTLTTNGSTKGVNQYIIRKSSPLVNTGLTLLDNWTNPNGSLVPVRGVLDLTGRTLNILSFSSSGAGGRVLNIAGADITIKNWGYYGTNISMDATDSRILVTGNMTTRTVAYNVVECSLAGGAFDIISTSFGSLLFSNTSLVSAAQITSNNTIRRLEYKGQGRFIGGDNVIDSLLTAENRNFFFTGSNTINKYYKATHPSCSGLGEIRSASGTSTIVFGANAKVDIDNVYMENISATGGGGTLTLPIPVDGADAGGNSGWTISLGASGARYWVGGGGDWNDASHWSTTSGGPAGACIPTVEDDVFFDANSGFSATPAAARTVTTSNGNAYFHNISWVGAPNNPIWTKAGSWTVESWGNSIKLNPTATLNISPLRLKGGEATVMEGNTLGDFDLNINKPGGSFTIANNYNNKLTAISIVEGDFNAPGKILNIEGISNGGYNNPMAFDISNTTINGSWTFSGNTSNRNLNATNSIINAGGFAANGFAYNVVNISGTDGNRAVIGTTTINTLTFTDPSSTSVAGINGANNKIGRLEFKGGGAVYGTGNIIDTLIFFPGNAYTFVNGTNTTITGAWYGSGTPCRLTEIKSNSGTAVATITKASGVVDFDYVRLTRMAATGGAAFGIKEHSFDLGGSTGWTIAPSNGAAPILGLGPDKGLKTSELPYTLNTDGFFGSPLSQYEWKFNGGVVGTGEKLVVTQPGTYTVKVNFPDGCTISDDIVITLVSADMSVTKSVDNIHPAAGSNVVFTVAVRNNGPAAATAVKVTDKVPTGYTYVSNTAPAGTYNTSTGVWTIGDLALNATASMTITAKVNANGDYVNKTFVATTSDDPNILNDTARVALVPTPVPVVTQPDCAVVTGKIELPQLDGATYSTDGSTFGAANVFSGLAPGSYSVVIKIGTATSAAVPVTVNAVPLPPAAPVTGGNQAVCAASPVQTLTATATVPGGTTITWYDAATNGNVVTSPTLNATGTVTYYAEAVNGTCHSTTRTAVILTINPLPQLTTHDPAPVCSPGTVNLTAAAVTTGSDAGLTLTYFTDAAGSTAVADPAAIDASCIYYIKGINPLTGCSRIVPVTVTVVGAPDLIVGQPTCAGGAGSITVTVPFGADYRYTLTGYPEQTDPVFDAVPTGSYFITARNIVTGCTSPQKSVTIDASPAPPVPVITQPTCANATGTITLPVYANATYSKNGGLNYGADNVFSALAPGTYSLIVEIAGCFSTPVSATVNAAPIVPSVPASGGDLITCSTDPMLPLLAAAGVPVNHTITWYDAATNGNVVTTPSLGTVGSVVYYASSSNGTCISVGRTAITLTVVQSPAIAAIADIIACGEVTLPLITGTHLSGNAAFYTAPNKGGTAYHPGDIISTVTMGAVTLYAYDETVGAITCSSQQSFEITVNAIPAPPLSGGDQEVCETRPIQTLTATATPATGTVTWYDAAINGSVVTDPILNTVGTVTYYAEAVTATCVSSTRTPVTLTINPTPAAPSPVATQPDCDETLGRIVLPVNPANEYSINNGGTFSAANVFEDLTPATYKVRTRLVGSTCVSDATDVIITAHATRPAAPTSGGDQLECGANPISVLTATATTPVGTQLTWYDAAVGGNVVSAPTLNATGTVIYYAESSTATCVSLNRTPVMLTIVASPVIDDIADQSACGPLTLPAITGVRLSGNEAYYTAPNKGGTQYQAGDEISLPGQMTLYAFDETSAITNTAANLSVATDVDYTSGQLAALFPGSRHVSGQISGAADMWTAGSSNIIPATPANGMVYTSLLGKATFTPGPTDVGDYVQVNMAGTFKVSALNSPVAGYAGRIAIINTATNELLYQTFTYDVAANQSVRLTVTGIIPAADLTAGNISVFAEMKADNWLGTDFTATCQYLPAAVTNCITEKSFKVTVNEIPATPTPVATQPGCGDITGTITLPVYANATYSINGGTSFGSDHEFTAVTPGIYSIIVKVNGCSSVPVSVTINPAPVVPVAPVSGGDQVSCSASIVLPLTATATVPVGHTLNWYDAATNGNAVATPSLSTAGTAIYYAESDNGTCVSTRTAVSLTIVQSPVIATIADISACGQVTLPVITGTGLSGTAAFYTAPNKGGTKYNPGNIFTTVGTTTLYAYDETAGAVTCPAEQSFQVTVNAIPVTPVSGGDQEVCETQPIQALTATATTATGTIKWYDAATNGNVVTSPILNTVGTITYYAEAVTATCKSTRTPVSLTILQSPVIAAIADISACGQVTLPLITGTDLSGNAAFYTAPNKGGTKYQPGAVFATVGQTTLYAYDEINNCSTEQSFKVTINEIPAAPVSGGNQEACKASPVQTLTAVATTVSGTIVWYDAATNGNVVTAPVLNTVGTITYYAEAATATCTSASRTQVTLTIQEIPVAVGGPAQTKNDVGLFTLAATPAVAGTTGSWTILSGTPAVAISNVNDPHATITLTDNSSVTLRWTVTSVTGLCTATDDVVLTYTPTVIVTSPPVVVDVTVTTKTGNAITIPVLDNARPGSGGSAIDPLTLEVPDHPASGSVKVNGDGTVIYTPDPGYKGMAVFTYRVKDVSGTWSNTASVTITVEPNDLEIPNVITPNGDGNNDRFVIKGLEKYSQNILVLFNRWGNTIYRRPNYQNDWGGEGLNEGTYYYTLKVIEANGQWRTYNGYIMLMR